MPCYRLVPLKDDGRRRLVSFTEAGNCGYPKIWAADWEEAVRIAGARKRKPKRFVVERLRFVGIDGHQ
jgi:hypothetical protein